MILYLVVSKGVGSQGAGGGSPETCRAPCKITRGTLMNLGFLLAPPPPKPNPGYTLVFLTATLPQSLLPPDISALRLHIVMVSFVAFETNNNSLSSANTQLKNRKKSVFA